MPFDPLNIEEHAAGLLCRYLVWRRDEVNPPVSSGIPGDLIILAPFAVDEEVKPVLKVLHADDSWPSKHNPNVTVTLELETIAYGEGRVDPSVDGAWNAAIRRAILDQSKFLAWLQSLSDEDRTGWKILSLVLRGGSVEVDTQREVRCRHSDFFMTFKVD